MLGVCLRFKAAEFTHPSDRNSPVPVAGAASAQDPRMIDRVEPAFSDVGDSVVDELRSH